MVTDNLDGIIVLGALRSGTTLLRRILNAHPNIACPGETHILNAAARFLHADSLIEGAEMGVLDGLNFAGFSEESVIDRLREFVLSFPRTHAKQQGKRLWAEKTALDTFYIDEIEKVFGEHAYFICVMRHGLDVACSNMELADKNGGYIDEFHEYIKLYKRPLVAFCHAWVDLTTNMLDFADRHPDNALVYRYEDLVDEPLMTMKQIVEFVGEDWEPSILDAAMSSGENVGFGDWKTYSKGKIESSSINRWKDLSPAMISCVGAIVNPTLIKLGYDPVPVGDDRDSDEARRRYELGLLIQASKKQESN